MLEEGEEEIREPKAPEWHEWNIPALRQWCLQANVNVAKLEPGDQSSFDYWLIVATLSKGNPIKIPVSLADYHKEALKEKKLNSSVSLNKRNGAWWSTVTYDEEIAISTLRGRQELPPGATFLLSIFPSLLKSWHNIVPYHVTWVARSANPPPSLLLCKRA